MRYKIYDYVWYVSTSGELFYGGLNQLNTVFTEESVNDVLLTQNHSLVFSRNGSVLAIDPENVFVLQPDYEGRMFVAHHIPHKSTGLASNWMRGPISDLTLRLASNDGKSELLVSANADTLNRTGVLRISVPDGLPSFDFGDGFLYQHEGLNTAAFDKYLTRSAWLKEGSLYFNGEKYDDKFSRANCLRARKDASFLVGFDYGQISRIDYALRENSGSGGTHWPIHVAAASMAGLVFDGESHIFAGTDVGLWEVDGHSGMKKKHSDVNIASIWSPFELAWFNPNDDFDFDGRQNGQMEYGHSPFVQRWKG